MIQDKVDGTTVLTDTSLKGKVWKDNVEVTATASDLNLVAGVAAGAGVAGVVAINYFFPFSFPPTANPRSPPSATVVAP